MFQTSFQVGGAIVLAIVTAVVDAGGASRITSAQATLGAYRPALAVITVVSALGAVAALSGLRSARSQVRPVPVPVLATARVRAIDGTPAPAMAANAAPETDAASATDAAPMTAPDLITGLAREVEEDCATPLCM